MAAVAFDPFADDAAEGDGDSDCGATGGRPAEATYRIAVASQDCGVALHDVAVPDPDFAASLPPLRWGGTEGSGVGPGPGVLRPLHARCMGWGRARGMRCMHAASTPTPMPRANPAQPQKRPAQPACRRGAAPAPVSLWLAPGGQRARGGRQRRPRPPPSLGARPAPRNSSTPTLLRAGGRARRCPGPRPRRAAVGRAVHSHGFSHGVPLGGGESVGQAGAGGGADGRGRAPAVGPGGGAPGAPSERRAAVAGVARPYVAVSPAHSALLLLSVHFELLSPSRSVTQASGRRRGKPRGAGGPHAPCATRALAAARTAAAWAGIEGGAHSSRSVSTSK